MATHEFSRRVRLDLNETAEIAIHNAIVEVEKMGADILLTEAINLLSQARDKVADYVDNKLNISIKTLGSNR